MTFEQNSALPRRFVTSWLPWLLGLGFLVVYLATMSGWATFSSIGIVAKTSGWTWQPDRDQPLAFLIYYPFRLLSEQQIPVALNVFNAVLASLVLVLVARAVALLPHDRTSDERDLNDEPNGLLIGRFGWIPPVFAAALIGLHISFWENATSVSAEMIDALVVAYVVRCLLEFRIDERPSWLIRSAFIYGLGITNNWALIGLAPFFLMAVIWLKGVSFFNARFIITMALAGMVGLMLYLLLPAVGSLSSPSVSFSAILKANLVSQKQMISLIFHYFKDNYRFIALGATSLLPLFFIALRWRSSFGDTSPIGIFIAKAVFHIVHAVFFAVCLLVLLNPAFSPRQVVPGLPFLNHTLFTALVIGYCSGYFLIVCSPALRSRRMNSLVRFAGYAGIGGVVALFIVMPVALVARNLEPIRLTNGKLLNVYMALATRAVPDTANIISDDPGRLAIARAYLVHTGKAANKLFYDTQSGGWSDYHAAQRQAQGDRWPALFSGVTNSSQIRPAGLVAFVNQLVSAAPTYYLEPSFGYYFERFNLVPNGLVYRLVPYPTNELLSTAVDAEVVAENQKLWADFDEQLLSQLKPLLDTEFAPRKAAWLNTLYQKLHLKDEGVGVAVPLGVYASRAANAWGVALQKRGLWPEAAAAFERAIDLSRDNVAANINLNYNQAYQAGNRAPVALAASVQDEFGKYNDWNQVMAACGPFDEPRFTFEQGQTFYNGGLYRQSIQTIKRVTQLDPTNYSAQVWLADLYTALGQPSNALEIVSLIRGEPSSFGLNPTKRLNLHRIEASALFRLNQKEPAKEILVAALKSPASDGQFQAIAAQLYLQAGMHIEALPLLESTVAAHPDDIRSLANLGYVYLQLEKFEQADQVLTRALEQDPKNSVVRLNRAITRLRSKQFDQSAEDYNLLAEQFPDAYQVHFGLGEIAAARNDVAGAAAYFEKCMKLTPPGTPDYEQVSNRLATIRSGSK
jgi:tetratricopeptide (TPR) repeat protein